MIKYFFTILISLLFFNETFAKNVSINENIDLEFVCDLEKKIIKNSEYNYTTFLAKDLNEKDLLIAIAAYVGNVRLIDNIKLTKL